MGLSFFSCSHRIKFFFLFFSCILRHSHIAPQAENSLHQNSFIHQITRLSIFFSMQQDDHFDSNETTLDADNDIKGPPKACLFVASLTNFTSKEELSQLFGVYGEILKIKLLKDHVSRPYAFIQFA